MVTANNRLRKQAKRVAKEVHNMNGTVKKAAQEKLRQIRKDGSKRYEEARGKMRLAERGVVKSIRDRPLRSTLIALGVGVVFAGVWFLRFTKWARSKSAA